MPTWLEQSSWCSSPADNALSLILILRRLVIQLTTGYCGTCRSLELHVIRLPAAVCLPCWGLLLLHVCQVIGVCKVRAL